MNTHVTVALNDLGALADLICGMDTRKAAPTIAQIGECHALIIKMMGEHASKYYADDETKAVA